MGERTTNGNGSIEFGGPSDRPEEQLWRSIARIEEATSAVQSSPDRSQAVVRVHSHDQVTDTSAVVELSYRQSPNRGYVPVVTHSTLLNEGDQIVQYRSRFEQDEDDSATLYQDNSRGNPDEEVVTSNPTVLAHMAELTAYLEQRVVNGQPGEDYEVE